MLTFFSSLQTIAAPFQLSTLKDAGVGCYSVQVRGKGGESETRWSEPACRDGTSRGKGIGENLGVKGLREIGVKFRMFSLSGSYCKLFPFLAPCLVFFICPVYRKRTESNRNLMNALVRTATVIPAAALNISQVSLFLCLYFLRADLCTNYRTNPQKTCGLI
jgi:hypothetical protein